MRDWSAFDIADWLEEQGIYRKLGSVQGCDGLTPHEGVTWDGKPINDGYFWVTAFVDLDYISMYLIDVRSHTDEGGESRDFLAIAIGPYKGREVQWWNRPQLTHEEWEPNRFYDSMVWFAQFCDQYLDRHEND